MIDFKKLISYEYLIGIDRAMLHRTDKGIFAIGAALVVAGIVFKLTGKLAPHQYAKNLWYRLSNWALTIGILEVLWFGLRYQNIRILGSHLTAFLILVVGLIWLVPIVKYWLGQYRRDVAQWEKDQQKQKYIKMQK
jgi:hypothetical protein